jgi:hypothetical protein
MGSISAAHGLRAVGKIGQNDDTGALTTYSVAVGNATAINQGDLVKLVVGGTIEKDTLTTSGKPIGVAHSFEYVDASGNKQFAHSIPASTAGIVKVYDDPNEVFAVQGDETLALTAKGANAAVVQGSPANGFSGQRLDSSTAAATATLPLRIVGFLGGDDGGEVGTTYPELLVKINTHFTAQATGNALA